METAQGVFVRAPVTACSLSAKTAQKLLYREVSYALNTATLDGRKVPLHCPGLFGIGVILVGHNELTGECPDTDGPCDTAH